MGEVLFELRRIGASVRCTAIDAETLTEVSVVGAAAAGEAALKRTALKKLHYVLSRRAPAARPERGS